MMRHDDDCDGGDDADDYFYDGDYNYENVNENDNIAVYKECIDFR